MVSFNEPLGDLSGKKVLAVGGTGGLGRTISLLLVKHGAEVTVVGRTLRDEESEKLKFIKADLTSMKASIELAKSLDASEYDVVLFTTGIFASKNREETEEGIEKDFAVSFLNRVAILDVLGPNLKSGSRVFIMGFPGKNQLGTPDDLNSDNYSFARCHMNTVAANESFVLDTAAKYPNLQVYGINPGFVNTDIRNNLLGTGWFSWILETLLSFFVVTPEQYAERVAPALFSPSLENYNAVNIDNKANLLAVSKSLTTEYAVEYLKKSRDLLAAHL